MEPIERIRWYGRAWIAFWMFFANTLELLGLYGSRAHCELVLLAAKGAFWTKVVSP